MHWHIDADIISLLVIVVLYISVRRIPRLDGNKLQSKYFNACFIVGMVTTVIDIVSSIAMDVPVSRFAYHVLMCLYFIAIEGIIVCWFYYCVSVMYSEDEKKCRRVNLAVTVPYALYAAVAVSNPWSGLIYSLGNNGEYSRGPWFFLMVLLFALYSIVLFILISLRRKKICDGYSAGILAVTPVILAAFIALQLLINGWLVIMGGYALCLMLAFLFLEVKRAEKNEVILNDLSNAALRDKMTGLYNRTGMESVLMRSEKEDKGKGCLVLIVDLDDLKDINDTYGHLNGDAAIKAVAKRLKTHFRSTDTVIRYGGDEFLVYIVGEINKGWLDNSLKLLVKELSEPCPGEDRDFPIHASIGAAVGKVGTDEFEDLCRQADMALYSVKRSGKNNYAHFDERMERETLF